MVSIIRSFGQIPLLVALAMHMFPIQSFGQSGEARAFWQDRWGLDADSKTQAFISYAAAHKSNIALCQVFGGGYALYNSSFVPKFTSVTPPTYDSLAAAVAAGHAQGLEVHAYINLCLVHQGSSPTPTAPGHLINSHPEWAMVNAAGVSDITKVGQAGTDIFYCPHQPGFRQYLIDVATEIATNYDVDGVHLDYVRYPSTADYCYCSLHQSDFQAQFGRAPSTGDADFDAMRFNDLTMLVSGINSAVKAVKPECKVTAAVWRTNRSNYQSPTAWLENGHLDAIAPMEYTSDLLVFEDWVKDYEPFAGGRQVWSGILASADKIDEQVIVSRNNATEGQAIFEYSSMNNPRTSSLDSVWDTVSPVPAMPWLDGSADTIFPKINLVKAAVVTNNSARIRWYTDEKGNSQVDYGTSINYGSTVSDANQVFDHDIALSGLSANTTYNFRVVSSDSAGHATASVNFQFTTPVSGAAPVIIDDGDVDFKFHGEWYKTVGSGGNNNDYIWSSEAPYVNAWGEWRPYIPTTGDYKVYARFRAGSNRCSSVPFTVYHNGGKTTTNINQQLNNDVWLLIGTYAFNQGYGGYCRVDNKATGGAVVVYDGVKFEPAAGGGGSTPVHVQSITMSWVKSGNKYKSRAVVNVKDNLGNNVAGATVVGNFTGAINNPGLSGITNASGSATITSTGSIQTGAVTFSVTNVTGTNMTYDSGANVVTSATHSR